MAYVYLEELEKILPGILDQWIDKDDESWEWIFQEIEQKCYIGGTERKNKKGKKWKKAIENSIDDLNQRVSDFIKDYGADVRMSKEKIETLGNRYTNLTNRVNLISKNANEAKSMAEIAKNRTETDYSKYSGKSDGTVSYDSTSEDINQWRNEHESDRSRFNNKCASCKHIRTEPYDQPCIGCCYNGMNISGMDKWEAKDE